MEDIKPPRPPKEGFRTRVQKFKVFAENSGVEIILIKEQMKNVEDERPPKSPAG